MVEWWQSASGRAVRGNGRDAIQVYGEIDMRR